MSKQYKILIILFVVAVLAVLFLVITSKPVNDIGKNIGDEPQKVDLVKLENDYRENVKVIFNNFLSLIENADLSVEQLKPVKNQLLDLRVPTKLKDLHIDFVLAITRMENFLESGEIEEKNDSEQMIKEIKEGYAWLN
jgi:hypothetical protein